MLNGNIKKILSKIIIVVVVGGAAVLYVHCHSVISFMRTH